VRPFASTISLDEARRRLSAAVRPIERAERVPIADAAGRVAAGDVVASVHVPPFARATMDGYALRAANTRAASRDRPVRFGVVDRIYTGQVSTARVDDGTAIEVATGAPLPEGADAVVMVEETSAPAGATGVIDVCAAATPGQNIGERGADIRPGDLIVRAGDILIPSRIGALAAIGAEGVDVYAKPAVAILSTGNEVVEPGTPLGPGEIYDVNRFTLSAVIAANGGTPVPRPPVRDTLAALTEALDGCRTADVVVFSGGSSVGDRDFVVDLIAARGEMIFHGIAMKPGKPTAFATVDGKAFFGMPGNPTSCLSNAYILLVPFLRATARLGSYAPATVRARLGKRIGSTAAKHQFYTVQLRGGVALPAFKGSSEITSLSQADGYVEIPIGRDALEEGAEVDVTLF
jgi:molybdenum cofactor synthesis domain-containing protein